MLSQPVIMKKYANRRLYNTGKRAVMSRSNIFLAKMVRSERDFLVYDAKSVRIARAMQLTQIIVEKEGKTGSNLLPIGFLRQLLRFTVTPSSVSFQNILEFSLATLTREQGEIPEAIHRLSPSPPPSRRCRRSGKHGHFRVRVRAVLHPPAAPRKRSPPPPPSPAASAASALEITLKAKLLSVMQ